MAFVAILSMRQAVDGHERHNCRNEHFFSLRQSICLIKETLLLHLITFIIAVAPQMKDHLLYKSKPSFTNKVLKKNSLAKYYFKYLTKKLSLVTNTLAM